MLLQCHVSELARDKILFSVWCRAWNKLQDIYRPSNSSNLFPPPEDPIVKFHVEQMVSRLIHIQRVDQDSEGTDQPTRSELCHQESPPVALVLSASEISKALDALYPKPAQLPTPFDSFLNSSATTFAAQYAQANKTSRDGFRERHSLSALAPSQTHHYSTADLQNSFRTSKIRASLNFEKLRRDLSTYNNESSS